MYNKMAGAMVCVLLVLGLPNVAAKTVYSDGIDSVVALSERLERENDPNYGDMYIQRKPKFRIVVLFADNQNRRAWLASLSPKLRRHVVIKEAKRSRQQFLREQDALSQALKLAGVDNYVLRYDLEAQQFWLDVDKAADREVALRAARQMHLDRDMWIRVGNLPVPE